MRPRPVAAAFACLLATGVGTGAGVPPAAVPRAEAAGAPAWGASPFVAEAAPPAAARAVVAVASAFPFAPGGDDLLAFDDAIVEPVAVPAAPGPAPRPPVATAGPAAMRAAAVPPPLVVRAAFGGADRDLRFVLDAMGRVAFLERDAHDRWHDRSDDLLDDDQRSACAAAAGAVAADFNGDGQPDVFVACDGPQVLFLSRADGRFARVETAFVLRATSVEAADADGDGRADVLLRDAGRPLVLHGQGDGSFALGSLSASGTR